MIARLWAVYYTEVLKMIRQKPALAGPLLIAATVGLVRFQQPLADGSTVRYAFLAYAGTVSVGLLGFVLVLLFSASSVATETSNGTMRLLLLRPIRRRELALAKVLVSMTYALIVMATAVVCSLGLAYAAGGLTGVTYGGEVIYTEMEMARAYGLALSLALLPLWACAAFGVMVSSLCRSPVTAITLCIAAWVIVDIAKYPLGFSDFVFTTYLEAPWLVFADRSDAIASPWMPMAGYGIGVCGSMIVACTLVTGLALRRRDFTP